MAEILIAIVIIGVVAMIVLPNFQNEINEKLYENSKKLFHSKMKEGLHRMRLQGELAVPYETTEKFISALSKHVTIAQVCNNNNLTSCFTYQIKDGPTSIKYDTAQTTKSTNLGASFEADMMGIRLTDGTSALLAYDPNCIITDTYNPNADVTACLIMIYDVNNQSGPNILSQDIATINLEDDIDAEDIEIGEIFPPTPVTNEQCEEIFYEGSLGIEYCYEKGEPDYWLGAMKECQSQGKRLPTEKELNMIVKKMYGQTLDMSRYNSSLSNLTLTKYGREVWAYKLNRTATTFWSNAEKGGSSMHASYVRFDQKAASYGNYFSTSQRKSSSPKAFCVD